MKGRFYDELAAKAVFICNFGLSKLAKGNFLQPLIQRCTLTHFGFSRVAYRNYHIRIPFYPH